MKTYAAIASLLVSAATVFAESIIVDNVPASPHIFTTTGAWATDTAVSGYYGSNYASANSSNTTSARWQPHITTAGYYKIYMKWTSVPSRPDRAPVEITYNGGSKTDATRRINQKINGGTWVYLGTYFLASGTNNSVVIRASDEGRICADAVLFELSEATSTAPTEPALTTPRVEYTNDFGIIARPIAAPLTVYYTNGTKSVVVNLNQTTNSSQWVPVGTYYLTAGTSNSVKLSAGAGVVTAADAVRFELTTDTNVSVIVDNDPPVGSPHVVTTAGDWTAATSPSGFYGTNYLFASVSGAAVRWRPNIPMAGNYNIYIRWPDNVYEIDRPEEVQIVRTDSGAAGVTPVFELRVEGETFYVKGSCGHETIEEIAAAGGNAIRTYSINSVSPDFLRRASDAGIKVLIGLWLAQAENSTADFYDDPVSVSNQFETLKAQIDTYKNYAAVLAWSIGNEIDPTTMTNPEPVYKAVQQIARYIRENDHYHPCMTVHAGSNTNKFIGVRRWVPDVDIIGVNAYEPGISNITPRMITAGWNGPGLITEYFLRPPQSPADKTSWDAPIEPVSADKYTQLLALYTNSILSQQNRCFGGFVFKGAQGGFRVTHTWYPILDENLKPTPSYDAMRINWGGPAAPELIAPQVTTIKLNNKTAAQDVIITTPGGVLTSAVTVDAPTTNLEYRVEIRTNATIDVGYSPTPLSTNLVTITQDSGTPSKFYVKNADLPNGDYRLFYYVRRTDGAVTTNDYVSVGTANIPFRKLTTNTWQLAITSGNPAWGSVSSTGGTYLASSTVQLSAAANPYYHFVQWAGDLTGTATSTNVQITSDMTVQAIFAEDLVTNGTPAWWLAQHGLGINDNAALADNDGDGLSAWQEYIAGTDPTNQNSALKISMPPGQPLQWPAVSGRVYTVYWTSNLLSGFQVAGSNVPWTSNLFTGNLQNAAGQGFYKIGVRQTP